MIVRPSANTHCVQKQSNFYSRLPASYAVMLGTYTTRMKADCDLMRPVRVRGRVTVLF